MAGAPEATGDGARESLAARSGGSLRAGGPFEVGSGDRAAERGVAVVCGIHEREGEFSRATLYNTLVTIGPDGAILNRHRKLVPTNAERMVWSPHRSSV